MNTKNKNNRINFILLIFIVLLCICVFGIIYYLFKTQKELEVFKEIKPKKNIIKDMDIRYYIIDGQIVQEKFKDLYLENRDLIGWLTIDDTVIDYPVMQTLQDEQFYLHMDFNKNYSYGGCIFADTSSDIKFPSDNILLYGHHMATGTMFAPLLKYENQDWADKHKYIQFDTLYENSTYEVIAAYRTEIFPEDYSGFIYDTFFNAEDENDFNSYVENIKKLSVIQNDIPIDYGDKLLSLSTCAYHTKNGRFVVVAKKIKTLRISENQPPVEMILSK